MGKSSQKELLWRAFAEWIKLRDTPNGYGNCISCNRLLQYPNSDGSAHAGHLFPRSTVFNALYFHPMNVHTQCHHCNTFLEGNTMEYRKGLVRRYGEEVLEELELAKATDRAAKWPDFEYKELAAEYRKKSRQLKKERGI